MQRPEVAGLRTRGRWPLPGGPRVALVGSRRPSPYGEAVAEQLSCDLAAAGVIVISGLALGIDAAAHRGALNGGGMTVAVMGTGVDLVYPAAHSRLAEDILAGGGALVSQFADGTQPRRGNFPARNWTMAAMSDAPAPEINLGEGTKAVINDPSVVAIAEKALKAAFGDRLRLTPANTTSEDFSEFAVAGVPSMMFNIGVYEPERWVAANTSGTPLAGNHSPLFAPVPSASVNKATTKKLGRWRRVRAA